MFGLGKKKKSDDPQANIALEGESKKSADVANQDEAGIFARLKNGLSRTRSKLSDGLAEIVLGEKTIDVNLLEDIETCLLYTSDAADE